MPSIVLRGFEELLSEFSKLTDRVAKKKIIAGAVRKAEVPVLEEFIRQAPDDPDTPGNRITKFARKSVLDQTSEGVLGQVGDTPPGFVGYFRQWGLDDGSADAFATRAFESTEAQFMDIFGTQLWAGVIGQAIEEEFDHE
jgi:hypothetical protein